MTPDQVTLQQILDLGYEQVGRDDLLEYVYVYRHQTSPTFVYLNKESGRLAYVDYGTRDIAHDHGEERIDYLSLCISECQIGEYWRPANPIPFREYDPSTALYALWYCGLMTEMERILGEPYVPDF
jgi:hypothetical protein